MENILTSQWAHRIKVINQSFQDYCKAGPGLYDFIVSNPPFFIDSWKPEDPGKEISRHDTLLRLGDLVSGVEKLLTWEGRCCLILPVKESNKMQMLAGEKGLHLHRICRVSPTTSLPVKRHLLEFTKMPVKTVRETGMSIERDNRHDYTDAYRDLTRDFYLAL
jgi:tRNA1Val (adenine37-N6)-methyltransferase